MRAPIFTCDWSRWGVAILVLRFSSKKLQINHGPDYVRWALTARLGPLGLDFEKTFYTKEN